jgi:hypothetical protein
VYEAERVSQIAGDPHIGFTEAHGLVELAAFRCGHRQRVVRRHGGIHHHFAGRPCVVSGEELEHAASIRLDAIELGPPKKGVRHQRISRGRQLHITERFHLLDGHVAVPACLSRPPLKSEVMSQQCCQPSKPPGLAQSSRQHVGLYEPLEAARTLPDGNQCAPKVDTDVDGPSQGVGGLGEMCDASKRLLEMLNRFTVRRTRHRSSSSRVAVCRRRLHSSP